MCFWFFSDITLSVISQLTSEQVEERDYCTEEETEVKILQQTVQLLLEPGQVIYLLCACVFIFL